MMSGVSELPAFGRLSTPDVNTEHMAEGSTLVPLLELEHANPAHAKSVLSDLKVQQENGQYCDVVLHVNDQQFYAHRCVLAANGSFFHNVFTQNQTDEPHHLSFPSTTPSVLKSVLDFIYSGSVSVTLPDADELLALCTTLDINALKKVLSEALQKHLDISNWFKMIQLALKHNIQHVTILVIAHLSENFAFLKDDKNLLSLDIKQMLAVCKRCNGNGDKDIEKDRLQLILKWISHDYESRERYYAEIMQTVNPDNLNSQTVHSFLALQAIKGSKLCDHFVTQALIKFISDREKFEQENIALEKSNETEVACPENSGKTELKSEEKDKSPVENNYNNGTTNKVPESDCSNVRKTKSSQMTRGEVSVDIKPPLSATGRTRKSSQKEKDHTPVKNYGETGDKALNESQALTAKRISKDEMYTSVKERPKRGRPGKIPSTEPRKQTSPYTATVKRKGLNKSRLQADNNTTLNDESISEVSPFKDPREMNGKIKQAQQKTSSTQTGPDESEDNSAFQSEIIPPMTKRPRSKKITSDTPRLQCPKCPRIFPTDSQLRHHMKGHGSDTPFLCDTCGFTTRHFGSMNVHRKLHDESQMLSCTWPGCSYKAIRRSRLEDHLNMHSGLKVFMCATCGKGFSGRKHLHRHEKLHVDIKPFTCDDCDYSSVRKDKLKDHVKKHHPQKAVDKGWLTEDGAAKVRPSIRHRPKSSRSSGEKDLCEKGKEPGGNSESTAGKMTKKNTVQFENLVEELLKAQEPQQQQQQQPPPPPSPQQSQFSQSNQQQSTVSSITPVLSQIQETNDQHLQHPPTLQTQQQVTQEELSSPQLQMVHPVQEQISSQIQPPAMLQANTQIGQQTIKSQTLMNASQNIVLQHPQQQTAMTEMIPNANGPVQHMVPYDQTMQATTPIPAAPSSQSYHSIPTSSTLSEEVYQFITYAGQPLRPTGKNVQSPPINPVASGQMAVTSTLVDNTRQVQAPNTQLQYQSGIVSQNPQESNQWK